MEDNLSKYNSGKNMGKVKDNFFAYEDEDLDSLSDIGIFDSLLLMYLQIKKLLKNLQ